MAPSRVSGSTSVDEARNALGKRLRELRQQARLTGKQLAESLAWPASKVSKLENARQTPTDRDILDWTRATNSEGETEALLASLPSMAVTLQAIGALVGALVFDAVMLVFTLVMRRGHNWARIVLAVFGSLRLLFLLFALIAGAANAVTAVLLLLLVAAIVTMFLPAANAWFARAYSAWNRRDEAH